MSSPRFVLRGWDRPPPEGAQYRSGSPETNVVKQMRAPSRLQSGVIEIVSSEVTR
jgi:hypothetical protein